MWLSNHKNQNISRLAVGFCGLALLVLSLAACGDVKIRQIGEENQKKLQRITIIEVNTREGQLYGRELRKLLHIGGKSAETYGLTSKINTSSSWTLSVQGASSELKKMSMTVMFVLTDLNTGKTLFEDDVTGDATIGAVTSLYGQEKSESHARERLAILLARRVVRRLQLYFLDQN